MSIVDPSIVCKGRSEPSRSSIKKSFLHAFFCANVKKDGMNIPVALWQLINITCFPRSGLAINYACFLLSCSANSFSVSASLYSVREFHLFCKDAKGRYYAFLYVPTGECRNELPVGDLIAYVRKLKWKNYRFYIFKSHTGYLKLSVLHPQPPQWILWL